MRPIDFQPRDAIRDRQLAALRELLAVLQAGNAFYGPRLRDAGLDTQLADLETFTSRMPYTLKSQLAADQRANPPYGTNLSEPIERYARLHQTSSTTGAPLRWLDTPESWSWMVDGWQRVLEAAGVERRDRFLVPFGFGPFIGLWLAFEASSRMGCLTISGGAMSSEMRLRVIREHEITVVCCTPTYALRLGEVARETGFDLAGCSVRLLILAGEPGGSIPATRALIESSWPAARPFDHHGMTEVGPVTYECPEHPGRLHVFEDAYLCEVADPATGAPMSASSSEPGELVLTTLGRVAAPVLRYRTGDLVRLDRRPCSCGRTSAVLDGGILGRIDDMVIVRGVNLYPAAIDQIIRHHAEVAEYRVRIGVVRGLTELSIDVEPEPACGDPSGLVAAVERDLRNAYNMRFAVDLVPSGALPRFELKARRWVREDVEGMAERRS